MTALDLLISHSQNRTPHLWARFWTCMIGYWYPHFWVPQPDSLSEISLLLLSALATCPTFTWMLALFKCWKCGCSESEMQQPSEFWEFVCEGSWNFFPHCLWTSDMCIIPMLKVPKSLRNSFICRLPQHLRSNVEPWVAGWCYVWEWTVPSVIFCGWDLVTFQKNGDLAKKGKVCQLAVGDMFCSSICEGPKVK